MILLRNYCNLPTDQKGLRRDFDASFFCQSCHFEPGLYVDWFLFVFASKSLCCYRYFSSTYSKLQQIFSFRIQNMCIFGHFPFNFLVANVASDTLILITFLCRTYITVIRPRLERFMSGNILKVRPNIAGYEPL